ncbi:MAG TPA: hypothetical protein DCR61_02665, partial [Verrucomicrobiales bacterium]|nr:hypothetical protein [Verrucomicrobiales bacterium]
LPASNYSKLRKGLLRQAPNKNYSHGFLDTKSSTHIKTSTPELFDPIADMDPVEQTLMKKAKA